jgi:hypothetical protein
MNRIEEGARARLAIWAAPLSRRKSEIIARIIERDYPHIVELPLPSGGFRAKSDNILAFHRERGIKPRRGRGCAGK